MYVCTKWQVETLICSASVDPFKLRLFSQGVWINYLEDLICLVSVEKCPLLFREIPLSEFIEEAMIYLPYIGLIKGYNAHVHVHCHAFLHWSQPVCIPPASPHVATT